MGQAFNFHRHPITPLDAVSMAEQVMQFSPASDADALKLLRASFPECPLSLRVAALNMLMRRKSAAANHGLR
jgi:hypothetical protein